MPYIALLILNYRELLDILSGKDNALNPQNLVDLLIEKDRDIKKVLKDGKLFLQLFCMLIIHYLI